jgi:hypothetical protein
MRASHALAVTFVLLALPAAPAGAHRRTVPVASCPDDVAAALAAQCPCDGAATHGQYVRCVVTFRNALRRARCLTDAARVTVRCAERSTCGKPGAVVCCLPCDASDGCTTRRARVLGNEATCVAAGGASAGAGSACGACAGDAGTSSTTTTTTSTTSTTTSTSSSTTSTTTTTLAPGTDFGNDVEFPGASDHSPDFLLGGPVAMPQAGMLTHLCVIAKSAGADVILSLYSDANADPAHLVASTAATPMTVGRMEIPVTPTQLPGGTYWIMGVYDADASIGIDQSDPSMPVRYTSQPFSTPLPDPFGPAFEYTGQTFNYYLKVE